MTVIINGSTGITFPNSTQQASAGSIIQVVSASTQNSTTNTTSTSFVTTGFSASITPKFATSKILASFSGGNFDNNSTANQAIFATLYRNNTTNLGGTNGMFQGKTVTARILSSGAFSVVDTPNTTSSTSYTLYIAGDGQNVFFNNSGNLLATITLMEIAA